MKKKPMTVKIGRRNNGNYEIATSRGSWLSGDFGFHFPEILAGFCDTGFERVTGFKLKTGLVAAD